MEYSIKHKKVFSVVGLKNVVDVTNNEEMMKMPQMWETALANSEFKELYAFLGEEFPGILGVWNPSGKAMHYNYYIGVATSNYTNSKLDVLAIEESDYVVFSCDKASIATTWNYINMEWFKAHDYKRAGKNEIELYLENDQCEIWIPITVV